MRQSHGSTKQFVVGNFTQLVERRQSYRVVPVTPGAIQHWVDACASGLRPTWDRRTRWRHTSVGRRRWHDKCAAERRRSVRGSVAHATRRRSARSYSPGAGHAEQLRNCSIRHCLSLSTCRTGCWQTTPVALPTSVINGIEVGMDMLRSHKLGAMMKSSSSSSSFNLSNRHSDKVTVYKSNMSRSPRHSTNTWPVVHTVNATGQLQ